MKRLLFIACIASAFAAAILASPAANAQAQPVHATKLPPPEILGTLKVDDIKPGLRVKLQLAGGGPLMGTVTQVTDTMITLDLSTEQSGLPGKFHFRKSEIASAWNVKPLTREEKDQVVAQREAVVSKLKVEVSDKVAKEKSQKKVAEEKAKAYENEYRKALDIVVSQEEEDRMRALLAEFPPGEWGEDRFRKVRETWVLYKLPPTPQESRFVNIYSDWKEAKDTIAILDARNEEQQGSLLLLKFPPSQGWGKDRLAQIAKREAANARLTDDEKEFRDSYDDWAKAVARRAEELQKPKPQGANTTAPKVSAAEKPATDKTPPADKPADKAPDVNKPAAVEKPAEAPAPAKEATPPAQPAEEKPAETKPADQTPAP
jgi:hypothetical protein